MKTDDGKWSPDFIGVGVERSATSWLWTCLDEHPQICMSHPKEIHYFNRNYDQGEKWYRQHFAPDAHTRIFGEINPVYMDDPLACERIARDYPNAKILVILRNPFERALSHLSVILRNEQGVVDNQDLGLARETVALDDKYLRRSLYYRGLKPYLRAFPRERIIILFYEDMKLDPQAFLHSLFFQLGVDADFLPASLEKIINRTSNYRFPLIFWGLVKLRQILKTLPVTERLVERFIKKSNLWSWSSRIFESDHAKKNGSKLEFEEVFGAEGRDIITADLELLVKDLHLKVPAGWN
ncbi:MAG: sulfotransferase [Deltaproteobacteria bacterium]|nr:MAG: sulfotransferase [Deltaproteobacteria bacterium]